jgi:hypothetical protein
VVSDRSLTLATQLEKERDNLSEELGKLEKNLPEKLEIGQKLAKQSLGELDKLEIEIKQLSEEIKAKKASSQSLRGKLEQFNQQISLLNNTDYYLKIYLRVEDLLSSLQKIINSKQPEINKESSLENTIANLKQEEQLFDRLLEPFSDLVKIEHALNKFRSHHLNKIVRQKVEEWKQIIEQRLKKAYMSSLSLLDWPKPFAKLKDVTEDKLQRFKSLFITAMTFQLMLQDRTKLAGKYCPLWPMDWLLEPILLRFRFHFRTKQETNRADKPEWYFAFIASTFTDHEKFFVLVQDILNSIDLAAYSPQVCVAAGLFDELAAKWAAEMTEVAIRPQLLTRVVAGAGALDASLDKYGDERPRAMSILLRNHTVLSKWVEHEASTAKTSIQKDLQKNDALTSIWPDLEESAETNALKETNPSRSVYHLFNVLLQLTEKAQTIPALSQRYYFFVQAHNALVADYLNEIFNMYHDKLTILDAEKITNLCMLINSCHYVINTLTEWGDQMFFLELKYYEEFRDSSVNEEKLLTLKGTIFTPIINKVKQFIKQMMDNLREFTMRAFKSTSNAYIYKKRIISSNLLKNDAVLHVSSEFEDALSVLQDVIARTSSTLAEKMFYKYWKKLALLINDYLFRQLVLQQYFNYNGALQFAFDMKGLFSIFRSFSSTPENYFKDLKESLVVLTMTAEQLAEFKQQLEKMNDKDKKLTVDSAHKFLSMKYNITKISLKDLETLVRLRVN